LGQLLPRAVIHPLAGKPVRRGDSAAARGAIREVLDVATLRPAGDRRAAQVVSVDKRHVVLGVAMGLGLAVMNWRPELAE